MGQNVKWAKMKKMSHAVPSEATSDNAEGAERVNGEVKMRKWFSHYRAKGDIGQRTQKSTKENGPKRKVGQNEENVSHEGTKARSCENQSFWKIGR
jgi:hypothetical protein